MFTWAQPGSGMFKFSSVNKTQTGRNYRATSDKKTSCYSPSRFQRSHGVLIKYLEYSLSGDVESNSGATTGDRFLSFLPFF